MARPSKYVTIFEGLRSRPGEWRVVAGGQANASQAHRLRKAHPGSEVTARQNDEGTWELFARYPMTPRRSGARTTGPVTATDSSTDDVTLD